LQASLDESVDNASPVSPDNAIGRLTRQDAMQAQQMALEIRRRTIGRAAPGGTRNEQVGCRQLRHLRPLRRGDLACQAERPAARACQSRNHLAQFHCVVSYWKQ